MDDVFYFSPELIETKSLEHLFDKLGYQSRLTLRPAPWFRITKSEVVFIWDFVSDIKSIPLSEVEQAIYTSISPANLWIVSYHLIDIDQLRRLLTSVLAELGGHIGCDDSWERLYSIENIDELGA